MTPDRLRTVAEAWLAQDPDPETRAELEALLRASGPGVAGPGVAGPGADGSVAAATELAARFAGRLEFGTAGLRGALGAGPLRMNRVTVRHAAAGLAAYLLECVPGAAEAGVVVGYDARHKSDVFADDTARVLAAAGIRAMVLPEPLPTPVVGFTVRQRGAAAGVVVTASHNPPADNGYKVFLGDGAQIVPPVDAEISTRIEAVATAAAAGTLVRLAEPGDRRIEHLGVEPLDAYVTMVAACSLVPDARDVRVAYTALHGVGQRPLLAAFERAGFAPPATVAEQAEPDGSFPTVAFPNPEEPGAMDLVLALAQRTGADLAIANDPDADRLGAAIPSADGWRLLRGDEIGWLLADHILRHSSGDDRLVVTTVVSSTLLAAMAASAGVAYAETLTGFKWIARAVAERPDRRFVFGYEQALGYLVTDQLRDKDGITAAVLLCEAAALAKQQGLTLQDRLDALAARFGRHATAERSLRLGPEEQSAVMARLRAAPPSAVDGVIVDRVLDRPDGNLVILELAGGGRLLVRPSGTEPKVKLYGEAIGADPEPLLDALAAHLSAG